MPGAMLTAAAMELNQTGLVWVVLCNGRIRAMNERRYTAVMKRWPHLLRGSVATLSLWRALCWQRLAEGKRS